MFKALIDVVEMHGRIFRTPVLVLRQLVTNGVVAGADIDVLGAANPTHILAAKAANYILSRYQIWFPTNMVLAKAAFHVGLYSVPRETIQTRYGSLTDHWSFQANLPTNFYLSCRKD